MRIVQFHACGRPPVLSIGGIEIPKPGAGGVRVRVPTAGVNPKDCWVHQGIVILVR